MKWLKILFEKFNTQQDGGLIENVNKAKRDLEEVQQGLFSNPGQNQNTAIKGKNIIAVTLRNAKAT